MTLREVVDQSLARNIPDSKTMKKNIEFIKNVSQNLQDKKVKEQMNTVTAGMEAQQIAKAEEEKEEKKNKAILQQKKPTGQVEKGAQISNNNTQAQSSNNNTQAQLGL